MKRSLSKTIGKKILTFPELEEVLLDVKCTTNDRPLCYQGEEFGHQVTMPNILLRGKPRAARSVSGRRPRQTGTRNSIDKTNRIYKEKQRATMKKMD